VYPCPLGTNEFLGVHTTNTTQGEAKLGPTAIPIWSREQYGGLLSVDRSEAIEICKLYLTCLRSKDYRLYLNLLFTEMRKYIRSNLVKDISAMLERVEVKDYTAWGNPGIFPQLVHKTTGLLRNDFLVEHDDVSLHCLNIVSPGWTSALAFTAAIEKLIK
jgi:L-2-hydroxyglutarate oxidase LhgO